MFPSGRKTGKKASFKCWQQAISDTEPQEIIDAAAEYAASDVGQGDYVKGPSPWLNQGCWEDDRAAWRNKSAQSQSKQTSSYEDLA